MKYFLSIILFSTFFLQTSAQWVNIDSSFAHALENSNFAGCVTGTQLDTNCAASSSINTIGMYFNYYEIHDITGIKYFKNLKQIECSFNYLTFIPALPPSLQYFGCTGNQISTLPNLPTGLINLFCGYNQLTALPSLPPSLKALSCPGNQLTNLPVLPLSLKSLTCDQNNITSLPVLPDSLHVVQIC